MDKIEIPQADYVVEAFKGIEESGILSYWTKISAVNRDLDYELAMRMHKLDNLEQMWESAVVFVSMNTSDSVFLETVTLCAMIVGLLVFVISIHCSWVRGRAWIGFRVRKLIKRWISFTELKTTSVQHYQQNRTEDGGKDLREKWKWWRDRKSGVGTK